MTAKILSTCKNLYPHLTNAEIAGLLGISPVTVNGWARKYGWKKSENFMETYKANSGRKRQVRENEVNSYDYWSFVKAFKEEQWQLHGKEHPFYESTQKQFKPKENTNGTD